VVPNAAFVHDLARAHRVPLVVSLHGSDVFMAERFAPAGFLARRALEQAGATTACSGDLHRRALVLGSRPECTRTVPYGVDISAFAPERADPGLRERLGIRDDELFVLALGRLVEKKGFRFLVEAAARTPGVRLVIAGRGDLEGELRELAQRTGAPLLLPGALEREPMAAALATADVVAVPSVVDRAGNVDGLPNTLLEALASGRPVLASRVAGIPDVVEDGSNGLLVPPGDAAALSGALARLRDEPELRRALGAAARAFAVQHLTWPVAAQAFEECYVQAAALGPR
jgi:glycosyltransferase involved in cell wall biosynthesis